MNGSVAVGGTLTAVTQTTQTKEMLLASKTEPAVASTSATFAVTYLNSVATGPVASLVVDNANRNQQPDGANA